MKTKLHIRYKCVEGLGLDPACSLVHPANFLTQDLSLIVKLGNSTRLVQQSFKIFLAPFPHCCNSRHTQPSCIYGCTIAVFKHTPEEGTQSHYRWLWATMGLLGIELRTSGRAVGALNHWAISSAWLYLILILSLEILFPNMVTYCWDGAVILGKCIA